MTKKTKTEREMGLTRNSVASELCEICARRDDRIETDVLGGDNKLHTVIRTCRGSEKCPGFKPGNLRVKG